MSAGKGGPLGAETEGSEWCPAPRYQALPGDGPRATALQGPVGHIPPQGPGLSSLSTWEERSLLGTPARQMGRSCCPASKGKGVPQAHSLRPPPTAPQACTSVGMLGTEPVKPFSAMVLWELLGELGPEPGALLHTDDTAGEVAVS